MLYRERAVFLHDDDTPPHWWLRNAAGKGTVATTHAPMRGSVRDWTARLRLYPWQQRALERWTESGHQGVIEAVTGAGKTRLALAAIAEEIARGGRAVAIVPTRDLQAQWFNEIHERLIAQLGVPARLGRMGDGGLDTLQNCDILVATVQSAQHKMLGLIGRHGLLVADEVHHYGAEIWSQALEDGFDRRLGLTATYEREDDGVEEILDPYFGGTCYQLGYQEALDEDVIAHFKIAFVGVPFLAAEAAEYDEQDERARRKRAKLINEYGLTPEPFGVFMREVSRLARSDTEGARQAGFYLSAFSKRRQVLAKAEGKYVSSATWFQPCRRPSAPSSSHRRWRPPGRR